MIASFSPSLARGEINAPTSKSVAHRLLICAALSESESIVRGITPCADVEATVDCLRALGANISIKDGIYTVNGIDMKKIAPSDVLNCRESGSTLRFLIPIAALSGAKVLFAGSEKLLSRPIGVYERLFEERELLLRRFRNCLFVDGPLPYGEYAVEGNVSSQFISGLLFALPVLGGDSIIRISPPYESRSYVDLTIMAQRQFGITIETTDEYTYRIPGNQRYKGGDFSVEGDYSGAAFLDAFNTLGGNVKVQGLREGSVQGDRVYLELYKKITEGAPEIDISDCPDLGPILIALAAYHNGAHFYGTNRLRIKESDRAAAMAEELGKFGADISVQANEIVVRKASLHAPNETVVGYNDHRIVMALSVLLTKFGGKIEGAEAISKSYPDFFEDIRSLGIEVDIYE